MRSREGFFVAFFGRSYDRLAGLASIQLSYLHRRGFVRTEPHPRARWRGRPRLLYHRGDLELAGSHWRAWKVAATMRE